MAPDVTSVHARPTSRLSVLLTELFPFGLTEEFRWLDFAGMLHRSALDEAAHASCSLRACARAAARTLLEIGHELV